MLHKICDYIVSTVINETFDFQYRIFFDEIENNFSIKLNDEWISDISLMLSQREEIADLYVDTDNFDIVIYTDYSPNYL